MPIFEYECGDCGHVTAFLEKAGKRGDHPCEECGSKRTKKRFSTFAAQSAPDAETCPCCTTGSCPMAGRCPGAS